MGDHFGTNMIMLAAFRHATTTANVMDLLKIAVRTLASWSAQA